jgi:hypothetical protein
LKQIKTFKKEGNLNIITRVTVVDKRKGAKRERKKKDKEQLSKTNWGKTSSTV